MTEHRDRTSRQGEKDFYEKHRVAHDEMYRRRIETHGEKGNTGN